MPCLHSLHTEMLRIAFCLAWFGLGLVFCLVFESSQPSDHLTQTGLCWKRNVLAQVSKGRANKPQTGKSQDSLGTFFQNTEAHVTLPHACQAWRLSVRGFRFPGERIWFAGVGQVSAACGHSA
jgi:hypothetical protein